MKKTAIMIITALMCLCLPAYAGAEALISVDSVQIKPGDTVTIDVNLSGNTSIAGGGFSVGYNPDVLEVTGSENGIIAAGGFAFINTSYAADKIMVGWAGLSTLPESGILCKITFKAKANGVSEITIGNTEVYDSSAKDVYVSVKNGGVLVTSSEDGVIYGDVYCDYKVDVKDAQRLYMYIVGSEQNLTEYEKKAADVYSDGSINVKDAQYLAQYLAGFSGIVLGE